MKRATWESILNGFDERLLFRVAPSKAIERDMVLAKVHLTTDQAIRPQGIDREAVPQQRDSPMGIGASQVDHLSGRRCLQVQMPVVGKRPPLWPGVGALGQPLSIGRQKLHRSVL